MIFGYKLSEIQAAIIAAIYLAFSIVMLFIVPPAGFLNAVLAVVPAFFMVVQVFEATEHSPGDLQKSLEALKAAITTAVTFYVATPASIDNAVTMLITGVVAAVGVAWARKGKVSSTSALHERNLPA